MVINGKKEKVINNLDSAIFEAAKLGGLATLAAAPTAMMTGSAMPAVLGGAFIGSAFLSLGSKLAKHLKDDITINRIRLLTNMANDSGVNYKDVKVKVKNNDAQVVEMSLDTLAEMQAGLKDAHYFNGPGAPISIDIESYIFARDGINNQSTLVGKPGPVQDALNQWRGNREAEAPEVTPSRGPRP